MTPLLVTSHVGRDLLQTAQLFRSERQVVWEYVANSLQYCDPGVSPRIIVSIDVRNKTITIADNGRGMDLRGLEHFFTMHGENLERRAGTIGRGLFGTGKSAAFGIADTLQVSSTRSGKKNVAKLERTVIEAAKGGKEIPVEAVVVEETSLESNGTTIEISDIRLKRLDREGVIRFIERHLARYPRDVEVFVDGHQCSYREPEVADTHVFTSSKEENPLLGEITLTVKEARSPLEEESRGIQVFSYGNWVSTTLAASEGKDMAEYLFGDVEVPAIEDYSGAIKPFDISRSGQLNPQSPIVEELYRFLGPAIESVRRGLVARRKKLAQTQLAAELAEHAARIASILNEDFAQFRLQLERARAAVAGRDPGTRSFTPIAGDEDGAWVEGDGELATRLPNDRSVMSDDDETGPHGNMPPDMPQPVQPDSTGETTGRPRGEEGKRRAPRGGIDVDYRNLGQSEHRAKYVPDGRQILLNLDHPQVAAAFSSGGRDVHDEAFTRLTWDIAICEYAVALARMRDDAGHYVAVDEPLFDIRETIDRLTRRIGHGE